MAYVSWLRSYFCARNTAIALAVLLVLTAIVRIAVGFHGFVTVDASGTTNFHMGENSLPIDAVMAITLIFGLIVATILAGPLARENAQHLEVVWTKPVSRTRYAFEAILANLCGVWAVQVMATIAFCVAAGFFIGPHFQAGPHTAFAAATAFLGPICWYAMYLAATSSLKRGLGAVQGLAWPVALVLPGLSLIGFFADSPSPLRVIHYVIATVNFINPMRYIGLNADKSTLAMLVPSHELRIVMLIALAIAYGAVGIWQWNRVEA